MYKYNHYLQYSNAHDVLYNGTEGNYNEAYRSNSNGSSYYKIWYCVNNLPVKSYTYLSASYYLWLYGDVIYNYYLALDTNTWTASHNKAVIGNYTELTEVVGGTYTGYYTNYGKL